MNRTFYTVAISQFLSSLADNALLIVSIALLVAMQEPDWVSPLLKISFVVPYVLFAPFVGAFADSRPKGQVMLISNLLKVCGCSLILFGTHPLLGYGIVGVGAALYAPAKYGILTELLPKDKLVAANGWMEGLIIASIIFGTLLGGFLISDYLYQILLQQNSELFMSHIQSSGDIAIHLISIIYLIAAILNVPLLNFGTRYQKLTLNCGDLLNNFSNCFRNLWLDRLGKISLIVTTLFWGAGATLQFIMLKWAEYALGMNLAQSAALQAISAIGVALGAVYAACRVSLQNSTNVLPYGALMGLVVCLIGMYNNELLPPTILVQVDFIKIVLNELPAYCLLILLGWLSGYFVVPMNALLQYRGYALMSTGQSIAVQGFSENISILVMLFIYSVLLWLNLSLTLIIIGFGLFVFLSMLFIMYGNSKAEGEDLNLVNNTAN
ncbi:lysophospholipid transporter LplT [Polynucleobacter sp. CS-Odin-A6]|uniref:lysophospholipid transporter LplT n=1 Tax=Polynucleobacter sp. CS-Odin-A6 TaxID=2689106 RepID=UPI001C0BB269|nr:lysophospholipid transporter LplT [Polynucleobacter sp. CS-Odin-A6]MBU3620373.1 lysophospholipid transporter LplT [Polynucleobacter sp. CS-Odin-A6]